MIHETSISILEIKCKVEFYLRFKACFGYRNVKPSGEWLACKDVVRISIGWGLKYEPYIYIYIFFS